MQYESFVFVPTRQIRIDPDAVRLSQNDELEGSFVAFLVQHLHEDRKDSLSLRDPLFESFAETASSILFMSFERIDAAVFHASFQHGDELFHDTLIVPWFLDSCSQFDTRVPLHFPDIEVASDGHRCETFESTFDCLEAIPEPKFYRLSLDKGCELLASLSGDSLVPRTRRTSETHRVSEIEKR